MKAFYMLLVNNYKQKYLKETELRIENNYQFGIRNRVDYIEHVYKNVPLVIFTLGI